MTEMPIQSARGLLSLTARETGTEFVLNPTQIEGVEYGEEGQATITSLGGRKYRTRQGYSDVVDAWSALLEGRPDVMAVRLR